MHDPAYSQSHKSLHITLPPNHFPTNTYHTSPPPLVSQAAKRPSSKIEVILMSHTIFVKVGNSVKSVCEDRIARV